MTITELDEALTKLHLADLEVRDKILAHHGQSILNVKRKRCKDCWLKEHGKCGEMCELHLLSDDPVEVSKAYLSSPNDISIFPFLYLHMLPIYEEVTGNKDTMKLLGKAFKRRWKEEKGSTEDFPNYL